MDLARDPSAAKQRTGYCPDVGGLIPRATPWEHLALAARLRRLPPVGRLAPALLDRFDLTSSSDRITAGFSHGMSRRMSVVLAAFHDPDVLLLDEPFDGVDPLGVEATLDVVADMRVRGCAVVVSTHLLCMPWRREEAVILLVGGAWLPQLPRLSSLVMTGPSATALSSRDPRMISGLGQTRALVGLRWRMVREPRSRLGLAAGVELLSAY